MSQIDRNHSSKAPYHKAHGAPTPASPSTPSSPSSGKSKKKEVEQKTESVQKSTDSSRKEWNPKGSDLSKDRMNKPDEVNVYEEVSEDFEGFLKDLENDEAGREVLSEYKKDLSQQEKIQKVVKKKLD